MKDEIKVGLFFTVLLTLTFITGGLLMKLFEYLGANMITIKGVFSCYLFPFVAYLLIGLRLCIKPKTK